MGDYEKAYGLMAAAAPSTSDMLQGLLATYPNDTPIRF
jgi:hypothetical protein